MISSRLAIQLASSEFNTIFQTYDEYLQEVKQASLADVTIFILRETRKKNRRRNVQLRANEPGASYSALIGMKNLRLIYTEMLA